MGITWRRSSGTARNRSCSSALVPACAKTDWQNLSCCLRPNLGSGNQYGKYAEPASLRQTGNMTISLTLSPRRSPPEPLVAGHARPRPSATGAVLTARGRFRTLNGQIQRPRDPFQTSLAVKTPLAGLPSKPFLSRSPPLAVISRTAIRPPRAARTTRPPR